MADVVDPATRSRMMSGIRGKNTRPEMTVRRLLHTSGFRYRLHAKDLPGKPDIVLPKYRVVIFVHGCFWHGHHCHLFKVPQTRMGFWMTKINGNIRRDAVAMHKLLDAGWRVAIVWECALKGWQRELLDAQFDGLRKWLVGGATQLIEVEGHSSASALPTSPTL